VVRMGPEALGVRHPGVGVGDRYSVFVEARGPTKTWCSNTGDCTRTDIVRVTRVHSDEDDDTKTPPTYDYRASA